MSLHLPAARNILKNLREMDSKTEILAAEAFELAKRLWSFNRSLTGHGNTQTLAVIKEYLPNLTFGSKNTGDPVFDWIVPNEWSISEAYIEDMSGNRFCDFKDHNLHVVGYSAPIDRIVHWDELKEHLHYSEILEDAVPYVTSYYNEDWGFCCTKNMFEQLPPGEYKVKIKSKLFPGKLVYGSNYLDNGGKADVFFSTYICHPSMANNELSGIVTQTLLAKYLSEYASEYDCNFRFAWVPETLGALCFASDHLKALKSKTRAGLVLSCTGDDNCYSIVHSRYADNLSDKISSYLMHTFRETAVTREYSWLERGSDERQYCSPGVDLPVATFSRTKFGEYAEYHTSADKLGTVVTKAGLQGSLKFLIYFSALASISHKPVAKFLGEPMLGKRGLYPLLSKNKSGRNARKLVNFLSFCDGNNDLTDIAAHIRINPEELIDIYVTCLEEKLVD